MACFKKQPAEMYPIGIDFTGKLPSGATLASATVSALSMSDGSNQTGTVLQSSTATIVGTQALIRVLGGTHGIQYQITFRATLSTGDVLEEEVYMYVEEQ